MDIIDRLNDPELYVDAIDDAIREIERLRCQNEHRSKSIIRLINEKQAIEKELSDIIKRIKQNRILEAEAV
jgi:hypothetical protein